MQREDGKKKLYNTNAKSLGNKHKKIELVIYEH